MTDALDLARCETLARALYETQAATAEDALVAAIATGRGWMRPDGTVCRSLPGALASWMSRVRGRGRPSKLPEERAPARARAPTLSHEARAVLDRVPQRRRGEWMSKAVMAYAKEQER